MTLNQLTYFCMLAKTQSYTQAAQALFIAQPSLSYAISTLEKELGCLLVAREGRRISLTPAGETFYRYAKAALESIDQGVQAVQRGGVIRLGAIATAMARRIPKLIVDFRAEHPQITVNVSVAASKDMLDQIESGELDAGLCSFMPGFDSLCFEPIYTESWVLITPPNHPLARLNRPVTLAEIARYPLLTYKSTSPVHHLLMEVFAAAGLTPDIAYALDDETAIGGMVASGAGLSLCLDVSLLTPFALARVPVADPLPKRVVYFAFRKNTPKDAAVMALFQKIEKWPEAAPLTSAKV